MITLEDLQAAIAECQGERNPNANTCMKLAAYYTLIEHLYGSGKPDVSGVVYPASYAEAPQKGTESGAISAISDSEFCKAVDGKQMRDVMPVLDDLMQAVSVLNPRLYAATIRKLNEA